MRKHSYTVTCEFPSGPYVVLGVVAYDEDHALSIAWPGILRTDRQPLTMIDVQVHDEGEVPEKTCH